MPGGPEISLDPSVLSFCLCVPCLFQGVAKLPFIDETRLIREIEKVEGTLTVSSKYTLCMRLFVAECPHGAHVQMSISFVLLAVVKLWMPKMGWPLQLGILQIEEKPLDCRERILRRPHV